MNKVLLGVVLGGVLGIFDGLTAWFTPAARPDIVGIVIGSTFKGLIAGVLIGWGLTWLALFANAGFRCSTDASCSGPDMTPWFIAAGILVAAGVAVAAVAVARDWPQPTG